MNRLTKKFVHCKTAKEAKIKWWGVLLFSGLTALLSPVILFTILSNTTDAGPSLFAIALFIVMLFIAVLSLTCLRPLYEKRIQLENRTCSYCHKAYTFPDDITYEILGTERTYYVDNNHAEHEGETTNLRVICTCGACGTEHEFKYHYHTETRVRNRLGIVIDEQPPASPDEELIGLFLH